MAKKDKRAAKAKRREGELGRTAAAVASQTTPPPEFSIDIAEEDYGTFLSRAEVQQRLHDHLEHQGVEVLGVEVTRFFTFVDFRAIATPTRRWIDECVADGIRFKTLPSRPLPGQQPWMQACLPFGVDDEIWVASDGSCLGEEPLEDARHSLRDGGTFAPRPRRAAERRRTGTDNLSAVLKKLVGPSL